MTKPLRTLKDIYDTSKMSYISDEAQEVVDELHQAAREWNICFEDWFYNDYKFKCEKCGCIKMEWNYEGEYRCVKCGFLYDPVYLWIRHFFNLESDLLTKSSTKNEDEYNTME